MYAWYQQAQVCYVYLSDLEWNWYMFASEFQKTRWFTRGWTLQELLAPQKLRFFDRHWQPVGDKTTLAPYIEAAARIPSGALDGSRSIHSFSIAQRMSWAASRSTTRVEDLAYCLMGLFRVNMPMLYGEGAKSFLRLQEEIMKESDDQSLFAWRAECEGDRHGLLADSPRAFKDSGDIVSLRGISNERDGHLSHAMT